MNTRSGQLTLDINEYVNSPRSCQKVHGQGRPRPHAGWSISACLISGYHYPATNPQRPQRHATVALGWNDRIACLSWLLSLGRVRFLPHGTLVALRGPLSVSPGHQPHPSSPEDTDFSHGAKLRLVEVAVVLYSHSNSPVLCALATTSTRLFVFDPEHSHRHHTLISAL
jgi:hypothetical protein